MRASPDVFSRIVCGIEQTPQSLETVRQALRLRVPGGSVHLVTVAPTYELEWVERAPTDALVEAASSAACSSSEAAACTGSARSEA